MDRNHLPHDQMVVVTMSVYQQFLAISELSWALSVVLQAGKSCAGALRSLEPSERWTSPCVRADRSSFLPRVCLFYHLPPGIDYSFPCLFNRNMSKSKGWTLQSSLLTLWMEKTRVNNQTKN